MEGNKRSGISELNENKPGDVLVVDDNRDNAELVASLLKYRGYKVRLVTSGKTAISSASYQPPDLVLLDIIMPEMDGYEVCKQLKANPETENIPVIFLTANVETEDMVKGFELGAVDYVTKPFNPPELLARVKTHVQLRRALQENEEQKGKLERQKETLEDQNQELIEAAKLKEDIDQIIRHDLKGPLQAIISYPRFILRKENLTENGKQYVNNISDAGYRMLSMINSSLDLYRMERGVYQLNPAPVNIVAVIKTVEIEVEKIRKIKNVTIKTTVLGRPLAHEDTFTVFGEELLCYSMLTNLIRNAIEASPKGESISIGLDKMESAIIKIVNKGVVPKQMRTNFFKKFSTYGKTSGTGLGTYSAKLTAEIQRGQISMATSENEGTTVTIQLPDKSFD